jgi:hypothetical protein
MAEELRLQEAFRQGGAVDLDERAVLPEAVVMDGAGDQLLPVPDSPVIRTVASVGAIWATVSRSRVIAAECPGG